MSQSLSTFVDRLGLSDLSSRLEVKPTILPAALFKFPPSSEPTTVPPPVKIEGLAHPFSVPANIYNDLLSPHVPITVALVYMSVVSFLNQVNAGRKYKPWAISRTRFFKLLVILHNIFLAVYSGWTCVGMFNALRVSLPEIDQDWKLSKTVDAFCKLHGPRGAGNAATYNTTTSAWTMTNRLFHLAADGLGPESTDVGRIWNEGLAFYGWLFYLSKFYEVVDTMIILAKGKKSSLLQTYHHAGAMLCMWAGIRYMSPPIWMFVLVNSGIHAIMYTFYLCSAIGVRVPKWFKQTLTTMQITQFVVGASYAFLHLFVAYQIPVGVPYLFHLGGVASKIVSEAPTEITSTIASAITSGADYRAWLKKVALRGAGYEGLAENVLNEKGKPFGVDAVHIIGDAIRREETRYRDELQWVHCLDTSGQVFAILLNCLYLAPLTWLFLQFFITSYLKQVERRRSRSASDAAIAARNSFLDASKGVSRRLSQAVQEMHSVSEDIGDDADYADGDEIKRDLKETVEQAKIVIKSGEENIRQTLQNSGLNPESVKQEFQRDMEAARRTLQNTLDQVKEVAGKASDAEITEKVVAKAQAIKDSAAEGIEQAVDTVKSVAAEAAKQIEPTINSTSETAGSLTEYASSTVSTAAEKVVELKEEVVEAVKGATGQEPDEMSETKTAADDANEDATSHTQNAGNGTAEADVTNEDAAPQAQEPAEDATEKPEEHTSDPSHSFVEVTAEDLQSKTDDLPKDDEENLEQSATSVEAEEQSEVEKSQSEPSLKAPNGNGTGVDEASGSSLNEKETPDESEEATSAAEKKEEDKIIDESQAVRDEDVDASVETNGEATTKHEAETETETATSAEDAGIGDKPSFADMVKKENDEEEREDKDEAEVKKEDEGGVEVKKEDEDEAEVKKEDDGDKDKEGWGI